jgi:hypothetical protein
MSSKSNLEQLKPVYFYPKEYGGPKPINEQITATAKIYGLDPSQAFTYAANLPKLPLGAEGWFAVPSLHGLAKKYFFGTDDYAEKYCRSCQLILDKLEESRPVKNYFFEQFDRLNLRIHLSALMQWELFNPQKGDILIIAAQLGLRYAGRSPYSARIDCFFSDSRDETVLGLLAVGSILLIHPERFVGGKELAIICAGDDILLNRVPNFGSAGDLVFYSSSDSFFYPISGAASAFVPKE